MAENDEDKELETALGVATDSITNGSPNGRKVAQRVLSVLTPILLRSPDPRIKALGIALGIAGQLIPARKQRRIGK